MSTAKLSIGSRTQLTGAAAALNNLANGTYVVLGTITHASSGKVPLSCTVELAVTPGTVSGNKQILLYAQASLDGTVFGTGPSSGTTTTDEGNLIPIGAIPLNTNATLQRRTFAIEMAMPGCVLPYATKLIAKNDSGVALGGSGNDLYLLDYSGDIN